MNPKKELLWGLWAGRGLGFRVSANLNCPAAAGRGECSNHHLCDIAGVDNANYALMVWDFTYSLHCASLFRSNKF